MFTAIIEKTELDGFRPRSRYPFNDMEVGDSIRFDEFRRAESARVAALQYAKRNRPDWKFAIRKSIHGWDIIRIA
jgi:hypothetical protein